MTLCKALEIYTQGCVLQVKNMLLSHYVSQVLLNCLKKQPVHYVRLILKDESLKDLTCLQRVGVHCGAC